MFHHTYVIVNFVSEWNINTIKRKCHVKCFPYHHGMARPQLVDGGDCLQIWRVVANILNKQSRSDDREWLFRLECWTRADTTSL
jgi:hypothetical protein